MTEGASARGWPWPLHIKLACALLALTVPAALFLQRPPDFMQIVWIGIISGAATGVIRTADAQRGADVGRWLERLCLLALAAACVAQLLVFGGPWAYAGFQDWRQAQHPGSISPPTDSGDTPRTTNPIAVPSGAESSPAVLEESDAAIAADTSGSGETASASASAPVAGEQRAAVPPSEEAATRRPIYRTIGQVVDSDGTPVEIIECNRFDGRRGPVHIYAYEGRPPAESFRGIYPPEWGALLGGRDWSTFEEVLRASCS